MKLELELEYLTPYLPYGLKVEYLFRTINGDIEERHELLHGINRQKVGFTVQLERIDKDGKLLSSIFNEIGNRVKPILRPLSMFINFSEITDEMNDIQTSLLLNRMSFGVSPIDGYCHDVPYSAILQMFKHHIDVFGLIEQGLAIDINTLSK